MIGIEPSDEQSTRLILTHLVGAASAFHLHVECACFALVAEQVIHLVVVRRLCQNLAILTAFRLVSNVGWRLLIALIVAESH